MRNHYWTCSKFADWLRGTTKLKCGTSEEWTEWEARAKSAYPIRWWLAEEGLDIAQKFFYGPTDLLHSIKYYINNRWVTRTHALTAHPRDIPRGQWRDVGNRFLPCLFNELVDYVEVELAWWHLVWEDKEQRAKYNAPWWRFGWWNLRMWRCPQAGLDNLKWQMSLTLDSEYPDQEIPTDKIGKPTSQAVRAKEIHDLYIWWTQVYRNRPDPMEASGWSAHCDEKRKMTGNDSVMSLFDDKNETKEFKKRGAAILKKLHKIEADYEKEDEAMLIRLIKIRHSLWT
jgi:hypothetical protein